MNADITAELVWNGKSHKLKYSFDLARRLRSQGINIITIYRAITANPSSAIDFGDDIAATTAYLLNEAGAAVTDEDVWRECMGNEATLKQVFGLFNWVCSQHFASSPLAPAPTKATAPKKAKTRKP